MSPLATRGPLLLLVEQGTLGVRVDQSVLLSSQGGVGGGRQVVHPAGAIVMAAGEQIMLPDVTGYTLRGMGEVETVILAIAAFPDDEGIDNRWIRSRALDEELFAPRIPAAISRTGPPPAWPEGVRTTVLADGIIRGQSRPAATLALSRLTLPPHTALPVHLTRGGELLVVEAGSAGVDLVHGEGTVRLAPGATLSDVRSLRSEARQRPIGAGGGVNLQPGTAVGIRPLVTTPLTLLILTLEPARSPP